MFCNEKAEKNCFMGFALKVLTRHYLYRLIRQKQNML